MYICGEPLPLPPAHRLHHAPLAEVLCHGVQLLHVLRLPYTGAVREGAEQFRRAQKPQAASASCN